MWIRKSEEEISVYLARKDVERKNIVRPLAFAAAFTAVAMLLFSFGLRGSTRGFFLFSKRPESLNARTIFVGVFLFLMFGAIAIYRQRNYGRAFSDDDDFARCRECKETAHVNIDKVCSSCGGKQEPTAFFSWIEDEELKKI